MKELSEWLAQSRYDMKTAQSLYASGRYIYYPETLAVLKKAYSRQDVFEILKKTEGVLRWITKQSNAV